MEVIKRILGELGVESVDGMDLNECYTLDREGPIEDLVIEKVREDRLSVAQVYTQRCDLMRDPEVVFDTSRDEWIPVRYRNDSMQIHQTSQSGLREVAGFVKNWSDTLESQKFVEQARERGSGTENSGKAGC